MDSETIYGEPFETAAEGILILDAETGFILDMNSATERLLHLSKGETLGKTIWDLSLPSDADAPKQAAHELIKKQPVHDEEQSIASKAGRCVNAEVVDSADRVNEDHVVRINNRARNHRKNANQMAIRMQQTKRLATVGQLAGGVAHDFNNVLGVILGYCDLLKEQPDLPEPSREMIAEMRNAGTSARVLIRRLLAFSRVETVQPIVFNLNETIKHMLGSQNALGRLIGKNIQLESSLEDSLGMICADPSQIDQVLMNLAVNARDAMPDGGKIVVETANLKIDEDSTPQFPSAKPGQYIMLTFGDTGIGMSPDTKSHIFEPFFSTKPSNKGTGLGLSTVSSIVAQLGGMIAVYSDPGAGATFKILFPRCDNASAVAPQRKAEPLDGGTETILLVEDAASLRKLVRRILADRGYTVLDSGDPDEALRMATEHAGPIPLMITDVELPKLSGPALAEKVAAIRPETKVLYASGYISDLAALSHVPGQEHAFLAKPFTRGDLLKKVRELLSPSTELPPRTGL